MGMNTVGVDDDARDMRARVLAMDERVGNEFADDDVADAYAVAASSSENASGIHFLQKSEISP